MNETEAFITHLCGTIIGIASATKLRNECLGFIHIVFLFKVRAFMLLSTQLIQWDAVRSKNSNCFKPACGAHFENDTASEK